MDRPGASLLRAGGQVGLQTQGLETSLGQGLQARLVLADSGEQLSGVLLIQLQQVGLALSVQEDGLGRGDQLA